MTDYDKLKAWDTGFKAYWEKKEQPDCPDYSSQDERDEWMMGWLTAQTADKTGV